jgi:hypothetical protein
MKLERLDEDEQDIDSIWAPVAKSGAIGTPTTKRTSQRLFRDHPKARFMVSTEAGGEGINLQFCHICINYDLPYARRAARGARLPLRPNQSCTGL